MSTTTPGADATSVVGKRIAAWTIDLVIYLVLSAVFSPLFPQPEVETRTIPDAPAEATSPGGRLQDGDGDGATATSSAAADAFCRDWQAENDRGICLPVPGNGETEIVTYVPHLSDASFWFAHLILYGIVSGLLGGSLGKRAVGLRVVTADGRLAGIGKNLLRTVLWVADAITCGFPVVGGILMLSTRGHRRIGDMAARTFVVEAHRVGQPVVVPGLNAPWTPPSPDTWGQLPGTGTGAGGAGWGTTSGGDTGRPIFGPHIGADSTAGYDDGPIWDQARDAYIQYDRTAEAWLQWDEDAAEWRPIDR